MAHCAHTYTRTPLDVRDHKLRCVVADFDDSWPTCDVATCDEHVNPRRVAAIGKCVCLLHGATKLEAVAALSQRVVPAGAKQGETYVADVRAHVRGIHKGRDQGTAHGN